jgi:hypothetical protein
MKWHREDGWTAEMLPPGTRPLVKGELVCKGDWCWSQYAKQRKTENGKKTPHILERDHLYYTTRPLTFTHKGHEWTWHRPGDPCPCKPDDKIQWLLVWEAEGKMPYIEVTKFAKQIGDNWNDIIAYRVLKWREKKPKVPLGPEDVPPGSVGTFYNKKFTETFPLTVSTKGVWFINPSNGNTEFRDWFMFKSDCKINRSIPLTGKWNPDAWEPCEK